MSSSKLLSNYIKEFVKSSTIVRRLWVFDFDDTLIKTDAKIHVTNSFGKTFDLTSSEFATYEKKHGESFDYSDFHTLINPRAIRWTNKILRNVYMHHGPQNIAILSARGAAEPIRQFLINEGINDVEIVALSNAEPNTKALWIEERINRDNYEAVEFFDDSYKNVNAVRNLRCKYPSVLFIARHITCNRIDSLHR